MPARRSPSSQTSAPGWKALVHDPASGETWLTSSYASQEALAVAVTGLRAALAPHLEVWEVYAPDQPVEELNPPPPGEWGCEG